MSTSKTQEYQINKKKSLTRHRTTTFCFLAWKYKLKSEMCCYSDLERARLVVYLVFQLPCFPTVKANALDCSFTCNRQIFLARKWICQLIPFHLSVLLGNLVYSHHKDTNISISTYRNKSKIIWQLSHVRRETIATRGFTFAILKVVIVQLIFYHDHLAVEKLYKLKAILCFSHSDWSSLMHCVWDYFILENTCSLSNENRAHRTLNQYISK